MLPQVYVGGEPLGGGDAPGSSQSLILSGDWPFQAPKLGARIAKLCRKGLARRDIVIEQGNVLHKIKGLALLKKAKCEIFVLNKEGAPPGYDDYQRLIVLMGSDAQVAQGVMQIANMLGSVSYCSAATRREPICERPHFLRCTRTMRKKATRGCLGTRRQCRCGSEAFRVGAL